jgi:hypothetical protein
VEKSDTIGMVMRFCRAPDNRCTLERKGKMHASQQDGGRLDREKLVNYQLLGRRGPNTTASMKLQPSDKGRN